MSYASRLANLLSRWSWPPIASRSDRTYCRHCSETNSRALTTLEVEELRSLLRKAMLGTGHSESGTPDRIAQDPIRRCWSREDSNMRFWLVATDDAPLTAAMAGWGASMRYAVLMIARGTPGVAVGGALAWIGWLLSGVASAAGA
jgi:hypothetical protein